MEVTHNDMGGPSTRNMDEANGVGSDFNPELSFSSLLPPPQQSTWDDEHATQGVHLGKDNSLPFSQQTIIVATSAALTATLNTVTSQCTGLSPLTREHDDTYVSPSTHWPPLDPTDDDMQATSTANVGEGNGDASDFSPELSFSSWLPTSQQSTQRATQGVQVSEDSVELDDDIPDKAESTSNVEGLSFFSWLPQEDHIHLGQGKIEKSRNPTCSSSTSVWYSISDEGPEYYRPVQKRRTPHGKGWGQEAFFPLFEGCTVN